MMKRILCILFILCVIDLAAMAQGAPPLRIREADGSPNKLGISTIVVTNGTLTISGTTATIVTGGGSSGLTIGTTTIASGTAGRFLYETSGNVLGEVSTLTSDGTILTFSPTVTTGTGATSGLNANANSLTTGDAFNFASSSVTSGNVFKIAATGTAAASNTKTALNVATSGANGTGSQTTYGAQITNTSTGSGTNIALNLSASGGTTNLALNVSAGLSRFASGTESAPGIAWGNQTGTGFYLPGGNSTVYSASGTAQWVSDNTSFVLRSANIFGWSASSPLIASDTAFARAAAGVIRITNGSTGAGGILVGSSSATGTAGSLVVASANADSLTVGPNGLTNPILQVVGNVASAATGLSITGNAAGSGVTLTALSSGTNEPMVAAPKGSGRFYAAAQALATFDPTGNGGTIEVYDGTSLASPGNRHTFIGKGIAPSPIVAMVSVGGFALSSSSTAATSVDTYWTRAGVANWRAGLPDAAAPVAQTLSVQNVVGGTSNTAGANWTLAASRGTGTGTGGDFIVQTAPAGGSGTTQNALAAAFTVKGNGAVELKTVTFANLPTVANAYLIYCSDCTIASPCASGGSGALAKGIAGAWVCN